MSCLWYFCEIVHGNTLSAIHNLWIYILLLIDYRLLCIYRNLKLLPPNVENIQRTALIFIYLSIIISVHEIIFHQSSSAFSYFQKYKLHENLNSIVVQASY